MLDPQTSKRSQVHKQKPQTFLHNPQAQQPRLLHYYRLERVTRDKHSSLLGLSISYEVTKLQYIHFSTRDPKTSRINYISMQRPNLQHLNPQAQQARVLHYNGLERITREKHSSLYDEVTEYTFQQQRSKDIQDKNLFTISLLYLIM